MFLNILPATNFEIILNRDKSKNNFYAFRFCYLPYVNTHTNVCLQTQINATKKGLIGKKPLYPLASNFKQYHQYHYATHHFTTTLGECLKLCTPSTLFSFYLGLYLINKKVNVEF